MRVKAILPFFCVLLCASCGTTTPDALSPEEVHPLRDGSWLFNMDIGDAVIPFNAEIRQQSGKRVLIIRNAAEEIVIDSIYREEDSLSLKLPVFGSKFKGKFLSDTVLSGFWYNASRGSDYKIPFSALFNRTERFVSEKRARHADFGGKWEVNFSPNTGDPCKAIGLFHQEGNHVSGTFLTEMGDYRFLEGVVNGDTLKLSCFDGSHAFLFNAHYLPDGSLSGTFWSGNHWRESWVAMRNDGFQLAHPDSLTLLKEDAGPFGFSFPDLKGDTVRFSDPQFTGKVVIVQLMGSWCPNCADESYMLSEFDDRYRKEGLVIVAIAYEKYENPSDAIQAIHHFCEGTKAGYMFLFGGKASKEKATGDFSMTNGVSSFPTTFFIDRKGNVRKIHTGFYGPGTGQYYIDYKEDMELFVEKLLREKIST